MLTATILTPERMLYEGEARSVFLPGATGEFEVLEFHKPLMSRLRKGRIIIDWERVLPVTSGVVKLRANRLVAIVEE